MEGSQTSRGGDRYDEKLMGGIAKLVGWPTPQVHDDKERGNTEAEHYHFPHDLSNAATWATPRSEDSECAGAHRGNADGLHSQANLTAWATPSARDWKNGQASEETLQKNSRPLNEQAVASLTASGRTPNGFGAGTKSTGQLNPAHPRWLQGLPTAWDDCAVMVTRCARKSPKAPSKPT
jgi:hypothetical protein